MNNILVMLVSNLRKFELDLLQIVEVLRETTNEFNAIEGDSTVITMSQLGPKNKNVFNQNLRTNLVSSSGQQESNLMTRTV